MLLQAVDGLRKVVDVGVENVEWLVSAFAYLRLEMRMVMRDLDLSFGERRCSIGRSSSKLVINPSQGRK